MQQAHGWGVFLAASDTREKREPALPGAAQTDLFSGTFFPSRPLSVSKVAPQESLFSWEPGCLFNPGQHRGVMVSSLPEVSPVSQDRLWVRQLMCSALHNLVRGELMFLLKQPWNPWEHPSLWETHFGFWPVFFREATGEGGGKVWHVVPALTCLAESREYVSFMNYCVLTHL